MLLTSGVTSLFCMYLIQSNIYELLAVQSKNGFPFSDCLISIDTKISIVLCSRIIFFLFTPRQSSDNPFDSSCEPLAYNIVYSMDYWWPVSLKTVCVCVCILTLNLRLGSSLRFTLVTTCPVFSSTSNILAEYG